MGSCTGLLPAALPSAQCPSPFLTATPALQGHSQLHCPCSGRMMRPSPLPFLLSQPQFRHSAPACPACDPLLARASFGPSALGFGGGEPTFGFPGPSSHSTSLACTGPQVRAAGRRWAAAYLERTGPGAAERQRALRVARGRAHPGRARVTARGGGCGAPARSCQALQSCVRPRHSRK